MDSDDYYSHFDEFNASQVYLVCPECWYIDKLDGKKYDADDFEFVVEPSRKVMKDVIMAFLFERCNYYGHYILAFNDLPDTDTSVQVEDYLYSFSIDRNPGGTLSGYKFSISKDGLVLQEDVFHIRKIVSYTSMPESA